MRNSKKIIGPNCGPINSKIMFIGEAPGRRGADQTLIPFHGDKSGDNFEHLISIAGLNRSQFYITNALLCNPKSEGNNATPRVSEIRNCMEFLKSQIDIVNPVIIVTLGSIALKALSMIELHGLTLKKDVATQNQWYNRILIPLYHPGQRAMLHRTFPKQENDFLHLANIVKKYI